MMRVSCTDKWCRSYYRGVRLYHSHYHAMREAMAINRMLRTRAVKVVMIKGHFAVVDHTWERND